MCNSHYIPEVKSRLEVLSVTLLFILNDCTDQALMSLYFSLFAKQSQEKYIDRGEERSTSATVQPPERAERLWKRNGQQMDDKSLPPLTFS